MLGGVRRIGSEQWRKNNFAATLSVFLLTAGFSFTIPFLPLYLQEIEDLSPERAVFWAGVASALGGVGSMISGPVWGVLGDRVGRKPMLVRAGFGGSIGLFLFAFAETTWQVVAIRLFIGVMAGAPAAAMALMATSTPPEHITRSLGVFQAATQGGLAIGPLVAAGLLSWLGFAMTFIVTAAVMLLGAIATVVLVVEDRVAVSDRKAAPKGALREALRSPTVVAILFVVAVVGLGRPMTQPILGAFVKEILDGTGSPNFTIGLLFFGMSALTALAALYTARINKRFGFNLVVLVTSLVSAVFMSLQGASANVVQLLLLSWVVAFLQGILATGTVVLLSTAVSAAVVSGVFGVYQSVQAGSGQIGPLLGGTLSVSLGFRWVFVIAGILFFFAGIVAYVVLQRSSRPSAVAAAAP